MDGLPTAIPVRPSSLPFPSTPLSLQSKSTVRTDSLTAVDVNIYASNPKHAHALIGNHENTEIGTFLRDYLDVDTEAVTKELKEQLETSSSKFDKSRLGKPFEEWDTMKDVDHYQGDFKKKRSLECKCGAVH